MGKTVKFRKPLLYKFLFTYVSLFHRVYYRRFTVIGAEKIPADTPVIFAPNHQNALMDALAVLFSTRRHLVFLARADIFRKPFIAKILNVIRMLPIYRIRDGYDSLDRNQEVFDNTVGVLKSNMPLCILPEGNHEGSKRLRPLKKGIFRIAFQSEESAGFNLNLHIVPVGLDYSNYFEPGADLTVVFGTPIRVADYAESYHQNQQKTINTLMKVLAESMRSVMIHIPEEHYALTYEISEMYAPNVWDTRNVKREPFNQLTIKQYIIQKVTEAFSQDPAKAVELSSSLSDYNHKLHKLGLKDCFFQEKQPRFFCILLETLLTILLLPIHIYGLVLNYLPYKIPVLAAAKIKDRHFQSSIHFGIGVLLFPIYYLLVITLFCIFSDGIVPKLLFGFSLPVSGLFAFYNYAHIQKLRLKLRYVILKFTQPGQFKNISNDRISILNQIKLTINS
ncbi:MAG: 1-acyl-sn-glycerol-3-phosphate acyltransferase [Bacteroidales bacterium]